MRTGIGVLARLAFWAAVVMIVVDATTTLFDRSEGALGVAAVVLFPITIIVWPVKHHEYTVIGFAMWQLLLIAVIAYPISTIIGRLPSIDRPGDF
jgi:hypothetical protein